MAEQIEILVVDDDKEIANLVEIYLSSTGYIIYKAYNAMDGLALLQKHDIKLAIIDVMMPKFVGIEMCRYMELNPGVLADINTIEVQDEVNDTKKHRVTVDGRDVVLTPIEFSILQLLASHPGRVFSTDEIYENVWNEKLYEANNTVMVHMRRLREKVEKNPRSPQLIKTVWGVGYKIEG